MGFKDWYTEKNLDNLKKQQSATNRSIEISSNFYLLSPRILTIIIYEGQKVYKDKIERYCFYTDDQYKLTQSQADTLKDILQKYPSHFIYLVSYYNQVKNPSKCKAESKKAITNLQLKNPAMDFSKFSLRHGGSTDPLDDNLNFSETTFSKKKSTRFEVMILEKKFCYDIFGPINLPNSKDLNIIGSNLRGLVTKIILMSEKNFRKIKVQFTLDNNIPIYEEIDLILEHLRNKLEPFNLILSAEHGTGNKYFYIKFLSKKIS